MRVILRENLLYLHKYITCTQVAVRLGFRDCRVHGSVLSVSSFSVSQDLGSLLECVQYKRAECRLLLSEMAFTMMRIFLQNHRLGASWVSHILRKRDIEMEKKLQGRKQHTGGAYINFAVSLFLHFAEKLQFYSLLE